MPHPTLERSVSRSSCLVATALLACGGGGGEGSGSGAFSDDTTCGAAISLSGALQLRVPPSRSSTACGTQASFGSGLDAGFLFVEGELSHADLVVDDVLEGETGSGFPARLRIVHEDGREWLAESCTAEILEHEDVGPAELGWESYRVAGSVTCEAATSVSAGAVPELEILSFTFVATISWG